MKSLRHSKIIASILIFLTFFVFGNTKLIKIRQFLPRNGNTTNIIPSNTTQGPYHLETSEIEAYCFVNLNGIVYDLNPLYDSTSDYYFKSIEGKNNFYFNFCKYGTSKCKKDNSYIMVSHDTKIENNTSNDCSILSGTNYANYPKWTIISNL
jgi:hypothetical protein